MSIIKENPITSAATAIGGIATILGALWAFDGHYASAADLQAVQQTFSKQLTQQRVDNLDDKIFELELKKNKQNGRLSPEDAAMLDRYHRRMDEAKDQLKQVEPPK